MVRRPVLLLLSAVIAGPLLAQQSEALNASVVETSLASPPPPAAEAPPGPPADQPEDDDEEYEYEIPAVGDLLQLGQTLFEHFAPEEIKERYRFPTREEWDSFAARLERALQSSSLSQLADLEPDARAALLALRALPDYAEYADWLEERLDDIGMAQQIAAEPPPARAVPRELDPAAADTDPSPLPDAGPVVPLYDLWLERMRQRPPPQRAAHLVPRLKPVFTQAQLPAALVWIAETESSFNPAARSPVGARGLFQLMPATAKDLGLRLTPFDERLDPLKNAGSAARYLSRLHGRFGDWPLTLAAYNAGQGRVSRLLKEHQATTFAEIAEALPVETRLYVPKVLATMTVREGVTPEALAAMAPRRLLGAPTAPTRPPGTPTGR